MKALLIPSAGILPVDELDYPTMCRLIAAIDACEKERYDVIVMSGGIFAPQDIQTQPAAEIMKSWFLNLEYFPVILTENRSRDTFENISFSLEVLREYCDTKYDITVVTQWQHAVRFWISFKALGMSIHLKMLRHEMSPFGGLREWAFILYHLYDPRGVKALAKRNRRNRTYPHTLLSG